MLIKPTFYFQVFKIMIIQSVLAQARDDRDTNIKEIVNTFSAKVRSVATILPLFSPAIMCFEVLNALIFLNCVTTKFTN